MQPFESDGSGKVHRLLRLLMLVQGRRGLNARALADELKVDERTVYRYIDDLTRIGVPCAFDPESGGYRIRGDFFLPPMQLTPLEALALCVLCGELAGKEQIAHMTPAWRALEKIRASLPSAAREEVDAHRGLVTIRTAQANPADGWGDYYEVVREAAARGRVLRCRYEPANPEEGGGSGEEFDFEPYALFFSVRAWYAVGRHCGRDALRTLKISRFERMEPTERFFARPEGFSMEGHLGNAWRMIRGERDYEVVIRFDGSFTQTMSDTQWHPTQTIEFNEDGSSVFRCTVSGLDEIVWWVLSMGPHCRVESPPELRRRVAELAARTAAQYSAG